MNAADSWQHSKYYASQQTTTCCTGPVSTAEDARATSAMAQEPKEPAMPSAEFQQIRKGGSGASRPLSAPCAKKNMQHVTFADRYTVPRHPTWGHASRQGGHATVKDSCTQWNQEDSWEAQRQSLAAVRHSATRTATEPKLPQTREFKKAILLHWYTRTYIKSERAMLAT